MRDLTHRVRCQRCFVSKGRINVETFPRKRVVGAGGRTLRLAATSAPTCYWNPRTDQREESNLGRALSLFQIFSPRAGGVSELSAALFVLAQDPDLMPPTQSVVDLGLN